MRSTLRAISYVIHPLFIPLITTLLYFAYSPRYAPQPFIIVKTVGVLILTVIIPLLIYTMLKTVGSVDTVHLKSIKERRTPLLASIALLLLVTRGVLIDMEYPELYYFFLGAVFSSITAWILALLEYKISLHMIAVTGLCAFLILLSIHYGINMLNAISLFILLGSGVATSRLWENAHEPHQIMFGILVGALPQIIMASFYL